MNLYTGGDCRSLSGYTLCHTVSDSRIQTAVECGRRSLGFAGNDCFYDGINDSDYGYLPQTDFLSSRRTHQSADDLYRQLRCTVHAGHFPGTGKISSRPQPDA